MHLLRTAPLIVHVSLVLCQRIHAEKFIILASNSEQTLSHAPTITIIPLPISSIGVIPSDSTQISISIDKSFRGPIVTTYTPSFTPLLSSSTGHWQESSSSSQAFGSFSTDTTASTDGTETMSSIASDISTTATPSRHPSTSDLPFSASPIIFPSVNLGSIFSSGTSSSLINLPFSDGISSFQSIVQSEATPGEFGSTPTEPTTWTHSILPKITDSTNSNLIPGQTSSSVGQLQSVSRPGNTMSGTIRQPTPGNPDETSTKSMHFSLGTPIPPDLRPTSTGTLTNSASTTNSGIGSPILQQPSTGSSQQPAAIVLGSSVLHPGTETVTVTQPGSPIIIIGPSEVIVGTQTATLPQGLLATTTLTVGGAIVTLAPPANISPMAMVGVPYSPSTPLKEVVVDGKTYTLPLIGETTLQQADGSNLVLGPTFISVGQRRFQIPSVKSPTDITAEGGGSTIKAQPAKIKSVNRKSGCGGLGCLFKALGSLTNAATNLAGGVTKLAETGASWATGEITDGDLTKTLGGLVGTATTGVTDLLPDLADIGKSFASDIENGLGSATQIGQEAFFDAFSEASTLGNRLQQISGLVSLVGSATGPALDTARSALKQAFDPDNSKSGSLPAAARALDTFAKQPWDNLQTASPSIATQTANTKTMDEPSSSSPTSVVSSATQTTTEMSTNSSAKCQTVTDVNAKRAAPDITNACPLSSTATSTSSSSSAVPTPEPTRQSYWIRSKDDADLVEFETFVKTLPDNGTGEIQKSSVLPWFEYFTKLNETEAQAVRAQSFIQWVWLQTGAWDEGNSAFRVIGSTPDSWKRNEYWRRANEPDMSTTNDTPFPKDANLQMRTLSASHLRIISKQKGSTEEQDYIFDSNLGRGTAVYVIDTGFNIKHKEFTARKDVKIRTYVVPNRHTLINVPSNYQHAFDGVDGDTTVDKMADWAFPRLDRTVNPPTVSYDGHGTCVASVLAGNTLGVASHTELILVKYQNAARRVSGQRLGGLMDGKYQQRQVTPEAICDALKFIIEDVQDKQLQGRAVINFSGGFSKSAGLDPEDHKRDLFMGFIPYLRKFNIALVLAVGNGGSSGGQQFSIDDTTPQNLIEAPSEVITVGGVNADGTLDYGTTPAVKGFLGGSASVYAQSQQVQCASNLDDSSVVMSQGTSLAAPVVGGKIGISKTTRDLKRFILEHAYQRVDDPFASVPEIEPWYEKQWDRPEKIEVVYNLAPEGLCYFSKPSHIKRWQQRAIAALGLHSRQSLPSPQQDVINSTTQDIDIVVNGTFVLDAAESYNLVPTACALQLSANPPPSTSLKQTATPEPSLTSIASSLALPSAITSLPPPSTSNSPVSSMPAVTDSVTTTESSSTTPQQPTRTTYKGPQRITPSTQAEKDYAAKCGPPSGLCNNPDFGGLFCCLGLSDVPGFRPTPTPA